MANGFTIANARRHQRCLVMRQFWDVNAEKLYREDRQSGRFTGTPEAWRTLANARRVANIVGHCPFTSRMMEKKGWTLK